MNNLNTLGQFLQNLVAFLNLVLGILQLLRELFQAKKPVATEVSEEEMQPVEMTQEQQHP